MKRPGSGIEIKSPAQLKLMRRAGLVVASALAEMSAACRPGVTTAELDAIGAEVLAANGAKSNFLNYGAGWGMPPFPAVSCISVNSEVVHGIPGPRKIAAGDMLSIDFGAVVDGWHGDAAVTVVVGDPSADQAALSDTTREAMWHGIAAARIGGRVTDISAAIEARVDAGEHDFGILTDYTGHGIGSAMHMAPDVPNYGKPHRGPKLAVGMCLAIEPMLTWGSEEVVVLEDQWTVATADGSLASHWEHTLAITREGLWVLTEPDGGEEMLGLLGAPFGPLAD